MDMDRNPLIRNSNGWRQGRNGFVWKILQLAKDNKCKTALTFVVLLSLFIAIIVATSGSKIEPTPNVSTTTELTTTKLTTTTTLPTTTTTVSPTTKTTTTTMTPTTAKTTPTTTTTTPITTKKTTTTTTSIPTSTTAKTTIPSTTTTTPSTTATTTRSTTKTTSVRTTTGPPLKISMPSKVCGGPCLIDSQCSSADDDKTGTKCQCSWWSVYSTRSTFTCQPVGKLNWFGKVEKLFHFSGRHHSVP